MSVSGDGCEFCEFKGCVDWDFARDCLASGDKIGLSIIPCPKCSPWAIEARERAANPPHDYRALLIHALPYCYEAADQTVQCPECNACWWGCAEEIDEDWHAPGCVLLAARVAVGVSKPVRRRSADEASEPYYPNVPWPETRTPEMVLRDIVLGGWFRRLNLMGRGEPPPEGVDAETWRKCVNEVFDRPQRGAETDQKRGMYSVNGDP